MMFCHLMMHYNGLVINVFGTVSWETGLIFILSYQDKYMRTDVVFERIIYFQYIDWINMNKPSPQFHVVPLSLEEILKLLSSIVFKRFVYDMTKCPRNGYSFALRWSPFRHLCHNVLCTYCVCSLSNNKLCETSVSHCVISRNGINAVTQSIDTTSATY